MALWWAPVKLVWMLLVAVLAKATTALVPKAKQRFEPRQASVKRREPLKWQGLEIALAV
jgi:hypothetical protein